MKIAVEGCMRGDLDNVYATLLHLEKVEKTKIDLPIFCGDFRAVRNDRDLESLSAMPECRTMNSLWKYYSGQQVAPFPNIFTGGNHEASNYLWEVIGGMSGIYNARRYHLGRYERPPSNENDIRSIYHVPEYDVYKLMQVEEPINIFLSHYWPVGITDYGNWQQLVRFKPYFKHQIQEKTFQSKAAADLLEKLKPPYWFSAHLHCQCAASVQHEESGPVTNFIALDKCLCIFHQSMDPMKYDEEWLAITRKTQSHLFNQKYHMWVKSKLATRGPKPFDFVQTVPPYNPNQPINPQTISLLQFLELPYLLDAAAE
ncbi:hypothetical protein MKX01_040011 [Papaver californicum]|nr:hypothetical protein MKX01_040011 [Papaver californicum]